VGEADVLITLSHPDLLEPVTKGQNIDILGDWERSKFQVSRVTDVETVPYISTLTSSVYFLIKPQILRRQLMYVSGKAISVLAYSGPKGSRMLSLPDFKTFGT
jgi:hypothetical protein